MEVLKDKIVEEIRTNPVLFGAVAKKLEVLPSSLTRLLLQNHPKLTQAGVLKILRDHLKIKSDKDLLVAA